MANRPDRNPGDDRDIHIEFAILALISIVCLLGGVGALVSMFG